jgi:perosamine synthetase
VNTFFSRNPVSFAPVGTNREQSRALRDWFPFDRPDRLTMTFFGTGAIYQAIRLLELTGSDTVLLPAYNCGHEVEPVLRAGAKVAFYRVDEHCAIDMDHLEQQCGDSVKALLVTHYFGFAQPLDVIVSLCRERGITLIEDCAHALFSTGPAGPLGTEGDYAVFSFRKSLPLADGGGLVSLRAGPRPVLVSPPALSFWPRHLHLRAKARLYNRAGTATWGRRLRYALTWPAWVIAQYLATLANKGGRIQHDPDDEDLDFPDAALRWAMSGSSRRSLELTSPTSVIARRRRHYEQLTALPIWDRTLQPLYRDLPDGVCPLCLPLRCRDANQLVEYLTQRGLPSVCWWADPHPAVPWQDFPTALQLKREIVVVPVHQELQPPSLDAYCEALAQFASRLTGS